jgi:hypothetical protein
MSTRDDSIRESFLSEHETTPPDSSAREWRRTQKSGISYNTEDGKQTAHPSRMVEKFERAGGRSDAYDDYLPVLDLPGTGSRYEDCGDDIPRFCGDCGHVTHAGRTCYRSGCPRCWKGWDRRRSTTISSKLEALRRYREASEGPGWRGWKFHHLAISPPDGYAMNVEDGDREQVLQRTFDLLKEVLGDMNVETGYLFYHPFRGEDGDDRGFWKNVLPDGEETTMDDLRDDLSFEPHFHAVVLAKFVPTEHVTERVEAETGWVINRITKGEDSDVSIYDKYDLARSTSYCLSHTGRGENRAAYRAFGEVANFSAEARIEREMDAAVRSVGVNTLGLKYDGQACVIEREKTETKTVMREKVNLGAAHGDGGEPELEEVEIEEEVVAKCEGRLLEIKAAPSRLSDEEWMEEAEHADDLAATWREWREEVDDLPEPDDWDDPGG